ncbi:MAG: hypothetical protein GY731_15585, partial [Gammaproteobacteria bacterium]|nr:hypothetical protein [Gammaproteobacteria bacterium]
FNKIPPGAFRQLLTQRLGELSNIKPEDLSPLLKSKSPSPPVRAIVRRDSARPPSLMRRTITLLLHHPELAKLVNNPETLATVELPGISVLTSMLELLLNNPHMKMAGILEYFRDTETGTHLLKLSRQEEPMVPGADLEQEFLDGTGKIQTQQGEKRFRELQERVASGTIAEEEKREYFKLLHSFSNGKPVPNTNT